MRKICLLLIFLVGLTSCAGTHDNPEAKQSNKRCKNVILLIGDGMGFQIVAIARNTLYGKDGELTLDKFPVTAFVRTYSADEFVTDSAAAATAMATGQKTNNLHISVDEKNNVLMTILEEAHKKGLATGIVTTTKVTHATPAAFYSHCTERSKEDEIAKQFCKNKNVDVLFGGGKKFFSDEMLNELKSAGYFIAFNSNELDKINTSKAVGLFAKGHMSYEIDRDRMREPSLSYMTQKAIEILSKNPKGFFLMVEGGRIDHAAHSDDFGTAVFEMFEFDNACEVALEFAKKNGDTIVIVTADHSTGGAQFIGTTNLPKLFDTPHSSDYIADELRKNDDAKIKEVFKKLTGYSDLTEREIELLIRGKKSSNVFDLPLYVGDMLSRRAGILGIELDTRLKLTKTYGHTGEDVPLWAYGPFSNELSGTIDNTFIAKFIRMRLLSE